MKVGYQDAGSWTLMKSTPVVRAQAAWRYAQFVTSKTVDVKRDHVGLTFIRESIIQHESLIERAPKLGGLVKFYHSPARVQWSPTGTNIPDHPKLAQLWWQNIGDAMSGAKTLQEALDSLCAEQERVRERLDRAGRPWPQDERGQGRAILARPARLAGGQAGHRKARRRNRVL
jgi:glycerol transport system substrate-binding protein